MWVQLFWCKQFSLAGSRDQHYFDLMQSFGKRTLHKGTFVELILFRVTELVVSGNHSPWSLLLTSAGHHWETCSNLFTWRPTPTAHPSPTSTDIWNLVEATETRTVSKRAGASYWNVFLFFQAKDFITKEAKSGKAKKSLQCALSNFVIELKNHDYYADHFARLSDREDLRICNGDGWFGCEGSFNVKRCSYLDHHINPYGNREMRIVFQQMGSRPWERLCCFYFKKKVEGH